MTDAARGRVGDLGGRSVPLLLASASPRRRELVAQLGVGFRCVPADIDEAVLPGEAPTAHVMRVARTKAEAVAAGSAEALVLAADTVVVVGDAILGKPADRSEARVMLRQLSGRSHTVLTAVAVVFAERAAVHLDAATVTFAPLPDHLIDWYLASGEADDKAGAYGIQGRAGMFVSHVEGNVQTVIGLPLAVLPGLLARVGLTLAAGADGLAISRPTGSALRAR